MWAIRQLGVTPAVTDQPDDVSIALDADEAEREVTFAVAGNGDAGAERAVADAPAGQLGVHRPCGGDGATLALDAGVADDGTEYRAVLSNDVGELASEPASLTVRAAPSLAVQPADVAAIEGNAALLKLLPAGNPAPDVQWQRLDGGTWTDVPGGTDLFLTIPRRRSRWTERSTASCSRTTSALRPRSRRD